MAPAGVSPLPRCRPLPSDIRANPPRDSTPTAARRRFTALLPTQPRRSPAEASVGNSGGTGPELHPHRRPSELHGPLTDASPRISDRGLRRRPGRNPPGNCIPTAVRQRFAAFLPTEAGASPTGATVGDPGGTRPKLHPHRGRSEICDTSTDASPAISDRGFRRRSEGKRPRTPSSPRPVGDSRRSHRRKPAAIRRRSGRARRRRRPSARGRAAPASRGCARCASSRSPH